MKIYENHVESRCILGGIQVKLVIFFAQVRWNLDEFRWFLVTSYSHFVEYAVLQQGFQSIQYVLFESDFRGFRSNFGEILMGFR